MLVALLHRHPTVTFTTISLTKQFIEEIYLPLWINRDTTAVIQLPIAGTEAETVPLQRRSFGPLTQIGKHRPDLRAITTRLDGASITEFGVKQVIDVRVDFCLRSWPIQVIQNQVKQTRLTEFIITDGYK